MNFNPIPYIKAVVAKASTLSGGGVLAATREAEALGPWQAALGSYVPRQVNPWLYEAIREAIGIIDGAIGTLVTMDGIVRVTGNNTALVAEIRAWIESVQVGDKQRGLQAFYAGQSNEQYEQGFAVGEWVPSTDGRDIAGLRVADSKGILFVRTDAGLETWYRAPGKPTGQRADGTDTVEALLRRTFNVQPVSMLEKGYVKLDNDREVYTVNEPEADNPYGTSKMRSLEFVSQVLVKIQNATGRAWERYGDPPLHLGYKTKNAKLTETQLAARQRALQAELSAALTSKSGGNSTDLVTATGALDEIAINVIGALGLALDPDKPTALLVDQIIAKFGTPAWLLGLESPGAAAERQSEMVLQSSRTRFELRKPGLTHLVATMLRMRGRTWKPGDWELEQELPSLQDMMKIAQANFLNAQAAMVGQGNNTPAPQGIDNNLRTSRRHTTGKTRGNKASDDEDGGEPWAEDGDHLSRIERRGIRAQLTLWQELMRAALAQLGFRMVAGIVQPVDVASETYAYDHNNTAPLSMLGTAFVNLSTAEEDAPLATAVDAAFDRGVLNAADDLDISIEGAIAEQFAEVRAQLRARGGELIRSATGRAYRDRIIGELSSGAFDGMNPTSVAATLQQKFDAGDYDWERLVRSEMAIAQSRGKLEQFKENGTEQYDYTTAGDDRVSEICLALAAGGPYEVGSPSAPIPVVSSHPNCRCSITPHIP